MKKNQGMLLEINLVTISILFSSVFVQSFLFSILIDIQYTEVWKLFLDLRIQLNNFCVSLGKVSFRLFALVNLLTIFWILKEKPILYVKKLVMYQIVNLVSIIYILVRFGLIFGLVQEYFSHFKDTLAVILLFLMIYIILFIIWGKEKKNEKI